jgi:hypothetical protein
MSTQVVSVTVSTEVNNTNPNVEDFWDKVKSFLMSAAEDELGLTPGSGEVEVGTVVSLVMGETTTAITATFSFAGTWTPD